MRILFRRSPVLSVCVTFLLIVLFTLTVGATTAAWVPNGSDITFEDGNVGIGIDDPTYLLHVQGTQGPGYGAPSGGSPSAPVLVAQEEDGANGFTEIRGTEELYISGDYAYISGKSDDGVEIVDISDPTNPASVAAISKDGGDYVTMDNPRGIFVMNDVLFVANQLGDSVIAIDVTNPASPSFESAVVNGSGGITDLDGPFSITGKGDYIYVSTGASNSVVIFDVSSPASISQVETIKNGTVSGDTYSDITANTTLSIFDDALYITSAANSAINIVDITDPTDIDFLSKIKQGSGGFSQIGFAKDVFKEGDYLYIPSNNSTGYLTVADVSNLSSPSVAKESVVMSGNSVLDVWVEEGYLYSPLNTTGKAFEILDVSDIDNMTIVFEANSTNGFDNIYPALDIKKSGNYIYIPGDTNHNFSVIEVGSSPTPSLIDTLIATQTGKVGIGTDSAPTQTLDVDGLVRTREGDKGTCDADAAGSIAYQETSGAGTFYGCRKTAIGFEWVSLH